MRGVPWFLGVVLFLTMLPSTAFSQDPPATAGCLECHGVDGMRPEGEAPDGMSLYLGSWDNAVHGSLDCIDCHTSVTSLEHPEELPAADCRGCHDEVVEAYSGGMHGVAFAAGDELAPTCASCHDPHNDLLSDDPASHLYRTNLAAICTRCHGDESGVGGRNNTAVPHPASSYARGAHAQAMLAGNKTAATCSDCHDSHAVLRARDSNSTVHHAMVSQTCGKCHTEISRAYEASVHGRAVDMGASGSPTCNSCHGEHAVVHLGGPDNPMVVANETCESCHSSPALARRYGLPEGAVPSYQDSYHGRAARGGLAQAAGCSSCHGVHNILEVSNPLSTIHPDQLVITCRKCHPSATLAFANSYAHAPNRDSSEETVVGWVRSIYLWLIGLVIGGMLLHNLLIFIRDIRTQYVRQRQQALHPRFNRGEMMQHTIFLVAFIVLVITGFALKYGDSMWARPLAWVGIDEPVRRIVHRTAGVVMILGSLYHLIYLVTRRGREQMRHMRLAMTDARDVGDNMAYQLGLSTQEPRFKRFSYMEKAEYWALMWGTAVMVITGLILWFPERLQGPSWLVRVSETVHLYEAWLAMLAIVVWHFFYVMFRPSVFPVSFTMMDGKMQMKELRREHRGEYDSLYDGDAIDPVSGGPDEA